MITRLEYIQLIALYSVLGMSESMTVFKGVKNSVLEDIYIQDPHHMLASLTTDSQLFCMQYCINSQACMSFSYNTDAKSCVLFDVVYGSTEKGYTMTNTRHYNIGDSGKTNFVLTDVRFPKMWNFDKCRLRRPRAASF